MKEESSNVVWVDWHANSVMRSWTVATQTPYCRFNPSAYKIGMVYIGAGGVTNGDNFYDLN